MKILKTLVVLEGETAIRRVDTIEHEGKLWLVPYWRDNPRAGCSQPERIILLDALDHQTVLDDPRCQFAQRYPIPKSVFEARIPTPEAFPYVVVEAPQIFLNRRGGFPD